MRLKPESRSPSTRARISALDFSFSADELQWLAESDFVQRLVVLLHSADPDSQSHAHVALTGLIRSSQLRSPSVITRAGKPAPHAQACPARASLPRTRKPAPHAQACARCAGSDASPVVDRSTVEKVFHGIQTNGFAASSASLGVLVELISKCVQCQLLMLGPFKKLLCSRRDYCALTFASDVSRKPPTKKATSSVLQSCRSLSQSSLGSSMLS
jgi:hypothetical protein